MLRIEDFKSRMQEIKQYRSNTGKGYWDWKALSLADGGEVEENTPKTALSEELYIQYKINLKIRNAYNNSVTRTEGVLPIVGGKPNPQTALEFDTEKQRLLGELLLKIEELKRLLSYAGPWKFSADEKIKQLELQYQTVNSRVYLPYVGGALGPGCLYTYTSNYGSLYMRSSNTLFESLSASVTGFTKINVNDVKPGDLVIRHDDKGGNHAMMYDSTDKNGLFLYNHSNGGAGSENYRVKARYPARLDQLTAYRFTGTHNDSIQWKKEYSTKGYKDGGEVEDTTELDIPVDDETRKKLIERSNAMSSKRGNLYTDEQLKLIRYKDSLRNEEINRQVDLVMSAMLDFVDTKSLSKSILTALKEQERENIEKLYPYKLALNSLATLGELGSAGYMLGKGAKTLGLISRFGSDTGLIAANTIGAISDGYLLMTANNNKEKLENIIELPADAAGIIGGTNWFRRTKLFGAYGNTIDNILDWTGYTAAGYDGIIKPIQGIFNFFNDKYKIEQ